MFVLSILGKLTQIIFEVRFNTAWVVCYGSSIYHRTRLEKTSFFIYKQERLIWLNYHPWHSFKHVLSILFWTDTAPWRSRLTMSHCLIVIRKKQIPVFIVILFQVEIIYTFEPRLIIVGESAWETNTPLYKLSINSFIIISRSMTQPSFR